MEEGQRREERGRKVRRKREREREREILIKRAREKELIRGLVQHVFFFRVIPTMCGAPRHLNFESKSEK